MKKCSQCKNKKELEDFYKNKNYKDGRNYICKTCCSIYKKQYNKTDKAKKLNKIYQDKYNNNEKRDYYKRMKLMYRSIVRRTKNDPYYKKLGVYFDYDWFLRFLKSNDDYKNCFKKYKASNYNKMFVPSTDRIDNNIGYTKTNIRIVPLFENLNKKKIIKINIGEKLYSKYLEESIKNKVSIEKYIKQILS